ncbi:MAG: PBP1A family penicillin-binding protein [Chloroflexota bacterium]|nr:PBP1A family penicillin-binding protein [Chloroflexota bacterium]
MKPSRISLPRVRISRIRARHALPLLALFVLCAGGGVYIWLFHDLPSIDRVQAGLQLPSTQIYDRNGQLLYEILAASATGGRNTIIPLDQMPQHCVNAAIATEDANYYAHPGVDIVGVVRAAWANLRGGEVVAGGSTITQQVARNLLLDPQQRAERTVTRKLREMILALRLSGVYSKDEILALYLNQSYFGNLAYGIEAAARAYFGKSASALALAECALLVGLLQAPAVYDPLTNLDVAKDRQAVVLDLMVQNGALTAAAAQTAKVEPLQFAASPFPIDAPHVVMAVIRQLERDYPAQLLSGGLRVTATVDLDWQRAAERIVNAALDGLNRPGDPARPPANANNAALVALDPHTGQVLVMLGSPNYFDESIDGAVNAALALRQPGSALKPFTYAAAMNPDLPEAWTPATMILDVRTPFVTRRLESYTPLNYGLVEHGPVSARAALASSLNIPAVVALDHAGIGAMVDLAADAGLTTLAQNTDLDLAVTLGGGEVRLLDLTQAYSIFANGGVRVEPSFILRVEDAAGNVLYQWRERAAPPRVIDERLAWLITDMLSDDEARIMGFGRNSALNIGRPAAAKTGTTTDYRDNWIVGYTPNLVAGVWVGNADNTPMQNVTGVSGAAPIWNRFMRAVLIGQPELDFERPDGLVQTAVCIPSGLLPTPRCPRTHREWFIAGTEPRAADNWYQTFALDRATGLLADENTPPERRVDRVYAVYPQAARAWAIRAGIPQPPADAENVQIVGADVNESIRLLSPDPYTVFELSPVLPRASQRIRLAVVAPPQTTRITYELDGQAIGAVDASPYVLWWTLDVGDHELIARAQTADGATHISAPIPFSVVVDAPLESYNQ